MMYSATESTMRYIFIYAILVLDHMNHCLHFNEIPFHGQQFVHNMHPKDSYNRILIFMLLRRQRTV